MLMVVLIDRNRRPSANLGPRMVLFTLGAALALGGMASGRRWLVWAATVVLVVAFALRFGPAPGPPGDTGEDDTRAGSDGTGEDGHGTPTG